MELTHSSSVIGNFLFSVIRQVKCWVLLFFFYLAVFVLVCHVFDMGLLCSESTGLIPICQTLYLYCLVIGIFGWIAQTLDQLRLVSIDLTKVLLLKMTWHLAWLSAWYNLYTLLVPLVWDFQAKTLLRLCVVADPDFPWDQILKLLNANFPEEFYMWISNLNQILTPLIERVRDLLQAMP